MLCPCLTLLALVLYIFVDVNYFLRTAFIIIYGKLFKKKQGIFESTEIGSWCTTQDLDIFMRHMNNARFLRDLDFARFDFYFRTGLYQAISKNKSHALQGACTIRYRRPIPIGAKYFLKTRLLYWEDKDIYLEHLFITSSDNFVRAIALSKQTAVGADTAKIIKELAKESYREPVMSEEVRQWNDSIESMSAKYRKKDN